MRYVRMGSVDSQAEEKKLVADIETGRVSARRAVEYVAHLQSLDANGIEKCRDAWIATKEERVVVFTGRKDEPTTKGGIRIWSAIELDAAGRPDTLLKIVGDYAGDLRAFADHMTDALDRYRKGKRFDE